MKHQAFTLLEILVVVAIVVILAAILYPVFQRPNEGGHRPSCLSNLKQIGLGTIQYTQDYDEKFPPVSNAVGSWGTLIFPYIKSDQVFQCPTDATRAAKTTDYYFNARLASVGAGKLSFSAVTILAGDGMGDQPTSYNLSQLPAAWITDQNSPARRHLESGNYLFADGHAKPIKPAVITLDKPAKNNPTFLLGP